MLDYFKIKNKSINFAYVLQSLKFCDRNLSIDSWGIDNI